MANIVATSGDTPIILADQDRLYVPRDVEIVITNIAIAIRSDLETNANQHEVAVDGVVIAMAANAIRLDENDTGLGENRLVVGETGIVRSLNITGNSSIYMLGSQSYLQNWGEITGNWGAFMQGLDDSVVENHGVIAGVLQDGVFFTGSQNVTVVNTGLITGLNGVEFNATSDGQVINSGSILSNGVGGWAISGSGNSGPIIVSNTGEIRSQGEAIQCGGAEDLVRNAGVIEGRVDLASGADTYLGVADGYVIGEVFGGLGDDLLRGGARADELTGGDGLDLLRGGAGDDELDGGADADDIRGGRGDDAISGGAGEDVLRGGDGADLLDGGSGIDQLTGGDGDDELSGSGGFDLLIGGRGEDLLMGGIGVDRLNGGADDDDLRGGGGRDVFVFIREAGHDLIRDFQDGLDTIDLQLFGLVPGDFGSVVAPAISEAGAGEVLLDLAQLGGSGSVLVQGLAFGDVDAGDFVL